MSDGTKHDVESREQLIEMVRAEERQKTRAEMEELRAAQALAANHLREIVHASEAALKASLQLMQLLKIDGKTTIVARKFVDAMEREPHETASRRYHALVQQLASDLGHAYGWQKIVAQRLGVDATALSRLINGGRETVSLRTISRAIARLDISPSFFFGSHESGHYSEFIEQKHDAKDET